MSLFTTSSKKFALCFAFFLSAAMLSFIGVFEGFIRTKVLPADNLVKYTEIYFNQDHDEFVLGDSHVAYGFSHNKMMNLGYPSDTIPVIASKLEGLMARKIPTPNEK